MRIQELRPPVGAKHARKRVGRGNASGHGTTATRGTKGQKARAGGGVRPGFEGGQLPIIKRLPFRRGFKNIFKTEYALVNVGDLDVFDPHTMVTIEKLVEAGVIKSAKLPVKILGMGELSKPLTVTAQKVSKTAKQKIEEAGGKVEGLGHATGAA